MKSDFPFGIPVHVPVNAYILTMDVDGLTRDIFVAHHQLGLSLLLQLGLLVVLLLLLQLNLLGLLVRHSCNAL